MLCKGGDTLISSVQDEQHSTSPSEYTNRDTRAERLPRWGFVSFFRRCVVLSPVSWYPLLSPVYRWDRRRGGTDSLFKRNPWH
jgi:hypothetical protein